MVERTIISMVSIIRLCANLKIFFSVQKDCGLTLFSSKTPLWLKERKSTKPHKAREG
jgi:hypothetical protein